MSQFVSKNEFTGFLYLSKEDVFTSAPIVHFKKVLYRYYLSYSIL